MALGQVGAVSKGRLCDYARCGIEELEKFVMPALLVATPDDLVLFVILLALPPAGVAAMTFWAWVLYFYRREKP